VRDEFSIRKLFPDILPKQLVEFELLDESLVEVKIANLWDRTYIYDIGSSLFVFGDINLTNF